MTETERAELLAKWNEGCVTEDEPSDETLAEYAQALAEEAAA